MQVIQMDSRVLKNRFERIFKHHFLIPKAWLLQTRKLQDLGLNQMELNEMFFEIENEFHINLDDAELSRVKTYGDAWQLVEKHFNVA